MRFPLYKLRMDDGYDVIVNIYQISTVNKLFDGPNYEVMMINGTKMLLTWREYERLDKLLQQASEEADAQ